MSSALRARTRSAGTTGGKSRLIATSETPTAPVGKGATSRLTIVLAAATGTSVGAAGRTIHKRGGNSAGVVFQSVRTGSSRVGCGGPGGDEALQRQ